MTGFPENYAPNAFASASLLRAKALAARQYEYGDFEDQIASFNMTDFGFIIFCTVIVYIITPAIGMFYGGFLAKKNAISMLFQTYVTTSVVTIAWYLMGWSLSTSSNSSSNFYGNLHFAALTHVQAQPLSEGGTIPAILYFVFSSFFPVCTCQIFIGAVAGRGNLWAAMVVVFVWTILVYCPLSYWTWNGNGWLYHLGDLDFAGGGPVHIASGCASLVYSLFMGPRIEWKKTGAIPHHRAPRPFLTFIGVSLIWMGWLCFNAGSLLAVNVRTAYILTNTELAATFACLTFVIVDYFLTGKLSLIAACEGAISGLVGITPACGFTTTWASCIIGIVTALVCRLTYGVNKWLRIDDTIYSFNLHGIGGIVGSILTGVFASPAVTATDGASVIEGGWVAGHWKQMGYQLAAIVCIMLWTMVFTYIILFLVNLIPGLKIRVPEEAEELGIDLSYMYEVLDDTIVDTTQKSTVEMVGESSTASSVHQVTEHAESKV